MRLRRFDYPGRREAAAGKETATQSRRMFEEEKRKKLKKKIFILLTAEQTSRTILLLIFLPNQVCLLFPFFLCGNQSPFGLVLSFPPPSPVTSQKDIYP